MIRVSGNVQGVGFRFFTHQKALKTGLNGYVRNLVNGDVEIMLQGEDDKLNVFIEWLKTGGPRSATISSLDIQTLATNELFTTFNVRY